MKINKEALTEKFKEQLAIRKQSMTDEQTSNSIDEVQKMYDDCAPFMRKDMHPIQHITASFMAGIQFALDNFKRGTIDLEVSTKDGGKNYDVKEHKRG